MYPEVFMEAKLGKVLEQTSCPVCDSSNAYTIYQDSKGVYNAHCYSCKYNVSDLYKDQNREEGTTGVSVGHTPAPNPKKYDNEHKIYSVDEALSHPIRGLKSRGLTQTTCEKFGVRVGVDTRDGVSPVYYLFPCHRKGNLTGFVQKIPNGTPPYQSVGDCKNLDLFGANLIPQKGKKVFITEGREDAMALYQALKMYSTINWEPSVLSLTNGASSVTKQLSKSLDLLNNYEEIILCFDSDAPGIEAAEEACKLLAGKVSVASLSEKDANEMILKNKHLELKWSVLTHAKKYEPDGIYNGKDCWQRYKSSSQSTSYPYPITMPGLNEKTYGIRPGSIVTITAGSGIGKTQFIRELKYHYFKTTNLKIADISLEEDLGDTIGGMLSLALNKRITLPDVSCTEDEERAAFKEIYGSGRFILYDHFGGMSDDSLESKLRYFAANGCRLFFLDHFSIVVSEFASEGGERERIDTLMTKLAKFVKETNSILFNIVHLRKTEKRNFEEGSIPSLDDLRGSASIKQLSWDIIALARNQQHYDPYCRNIVTLHCLKSRFTGRTGPAGAIRFDDVTGRYIQCPIPPNYYGSAKL